MSKQRMSAGDAAIAGQREIQSSPHAVALNYGDGGSGEASDGGHQALTHLRETERSRAVQRRDLFKVGACREKPRIAGDHQARGWMRHKLLDSSGEGLHSGARQAGRVLVGDEAVNGGAATRLARAQSFLGSGMHRELE